ncbi:MAG: T9SS type A sorting domain-containing protein [Ignavibacteria bacterium]|jgi:photosystem II stability/assembly factor-like uncharacterized protein|nr:T9SS type A sorting domain-containing protein [Ignavibacteria bacterium]
MKKLLLLFVLATMTVATNNLFSKEALGPGGGGRMLFPLINSLNNDNIFIFCDMSSAFSSRDGGKNFKLHKFQNRGRFYCSPHNAKKVFALNTYLSLSTDGGETFKIIFPKDTSNIANLTVHEGKIIGMVMDPADSNTMYFVTSGYYDAQWEPKPTIYKSTDNGENWKVIASLANKLFPDLGDSYAGFQIDPTSPVGSRKLDILSAKGVFKVSDNGKVDTILLRANKSGAIYYDKQTNKNYFFIIESATTGVDKFANQVSRSNDGGITWLPITTTFSERWLHWNTGEPNSNGKRIFKQLAVSSLNDIYVCFGDTLDSKTGGMDMGVARTFDGGASWKIGLKGWSLSNINNPYYVDVWVGEFGWSGTSSGLSASLSDPNIAIMTNMGDALITRDGGDTWESISNDYDSTTNTYSSRGLWVTCNHGYYVDPFDSLHQFICYTDIFLMESKDGGKSWNWSKNGIPSGWLNTCYDIAFDKDNRDFILSAWSNMHSKDVAAAINLVENHSGSYIGGVARSIDGGKNWIPINPNSDKTSYTDNDGVSGLPDHAICTSITIDPNSPTNPAQRVVYVTCFGYGVYKSTDGGQTFTKFNDGMNETRYHTSKFVWSPDYSRLYCLFSSNEKSSAESSTYYLDKNATQWIKLANYPNNNSVTMLNSISVAPNSNNNTIYTTGYRHSAGEWGENIHYFNSGAYVSTDGGNAWREIYPDTITTNAIHVDSRNADVLYLGNGIGQVLVSFKGANTMPDDWCEVPGFLFHSVASIQEDPFDSTMIYVSTSGASVFRLKTPYPTAIEADNYSNENILIYPNPINDKANIVLNLQVDASLTITINDILGREVMQVYDNKAVAGIFSQSFDLYNFPAGVYYITMVVNGRRIVKSVIKY